ncbi:hypothetical protein QJQ45_015591, partial [Haematococcus lacustris]
AKCCNQLQPPHGRFTCATNSYVMKYTVIVQAGMRHFLLPGVGFLAYTPMQQPAYTQVIVLGAPVCSKESVGQLLKVFLSRYPRAMFLQVPHELGTHLSAEHGFLVNAFGGETQLDVSSYSYKGNNKKALRLVAARAKRDGVMVEEAHRPDLGVHQGEGQPRSPPSAAHSPSSTLSPGLAAQLHRVSEEWMEGKGLSARGSWFLVRKPVFELEAPADPTLPSGASAAAEAPGHSWRGATVAAAGADGGVGGGVGKGSGDVWGPEGGRHVVGFVVLDPMWHQGRVTGYYANIEIMAVLKEEQQQQQQHSVSTPAPGTGGGGVKEGRVSQRQRLKAAKAARAAQDMDPSLQATPLPLQPNGEAQGQSQGKGQGQGHGQGKAKGQGAGQVPVQGKGCRQGKVQGLSQSKGPELAEGEVQTKGQEQGKGRGAGKGSGQNAEQRQGAGQGKQRGGTEPQAVGQGLATLQSKGSRAPTSDSSHGPGTHDSPATSLPAVTAVQSLAAGVSTFSAPLPLPCGPPTPPAAAIPAALLGSSQQALPPVHPGGLEGQQQLKRGQGGQQQVAGDCMGCGPGGQLRCGLHYGAEGLAVAENAALSSTSSNVGSSGRGGSSGGSSGSGSAEVVALCVPTQQQQQQQQQPQQHQEQQPTAKGGQRIQVPATAPRVHPLAKSVTAAAGAGPAAGAAAVVAGAEAGGEERDQLPGVTLVLSLGLSPLYCLVEEQRPHVFRHSKTVRRILKLTFKLGNPFYPYKNLAAAKARYGGGASGLEARGQYDDPAARWLPMYIAMPPVAAHSGQDMLQMGVTTGMHKGLLQCSKVLIREELAKALRKRRSGKKKTAAEGRGEEDGGRERDGDAAHNCA